MNKLMLAIIVSSACVSHAQAGGEYNSASTDNTTLQDMRYWKQVSAKFDKLDENEDGFITEGEAKDEAVDEHFSAIDELKIEDDRISRAEYKIYVNMHETDMTGDESAKGTNESAHKDKGNKSSAGIDTISYSGGAGYKMSDDDVETDEKYEGNDEYKGKIDTITYAGSAGNSKTVTDTTDNEYDGDDEYSGKIDTISYSGSVGQQTANVAESYEYTKNNSEKRNIAYRFNEIDNNMDGSLTELEMEGYELDSEFDDIDVNNDNNVSKNEYKSYLNGESYIDE